ncbi:MAG: indole-3-glycerol phosphate synthase TrpC [bacterium]
MLEEILGWKRTEVARQKSGVPLSGLKKACRDLPPVLDFQKALQGATRISIIAEIKKASPSRGIIRRDFDPLQIARCYEREGAAALSILTDRKFFQGDLRYLQQVRQVSNLPLLRKDFIVDAYQIYEARLAGADAVLLIADALSESELIDLYGLAKDLGLHVLLEIHDQKELDKILSTGSPIVGINNRNLKTFQVDLAVTARLISLIPEDRLVVSESGIYQADQLRWLRGLGVAAVLVGEALMAREDISQAFRELRGGHARETR